MSDTDAERVELTAGDGWTIGATLRRPDAVGGIGPGVVTVPGSRHERDAWTQVANALVPRGFSVLQIDIRGRGASAGHTTYAAMGPVARRRVRLDVAAAIDHLAALEQVDPSRLGVLVEQDTAVDALEAVAADSRVQAIVMLSVRGARRAAAAIAERSPAVYGLVSAEDRHGVRATVDGFLASTDRRSRIDVFHGVGVGVTMASVMQFESPDLLQLDVRIAGWLDELLGTVQGS